MTSFLLFLLGYFSTCVFFWPPRQYHCILWFSTSFSFKPSDFYLFFFYFLWYVCIYFFFFQRLVSSFASPVHLWSYLVSYCNSTPTVVPYPKESFFVCIYMSGSEEEEETKNLGFFYVSNGVYVKSFNLTDSRLGR